MEVDAISRQARAAVDHLTEQLRSLEHEQTALLTSLHLTSSTLSTLPSYTAIAPTLSQIPHYESKLARLKAAMAQQQRDVAELKRRALEAGAKRRLNLSRIEEKRRGERERDRTILKAKHASVREEEEVEVQQQKGEGGEERLGGDGRGDNAGSEGVVAETPEVQMLQTPSAVKTVRRKKKARQADIQ